MNAISAWGVLWYSKNKLDGVSEHLLYKDCLPVLFRTKREAYNWIKKEYGYIKHRKDLKAEPYGWRMPRPIRINVRVAGEK